MIIRGENVSWQQGCCLNVRNMRHQNYGVYSNMKNCDNIEQLRLMRRLTGVNQD